MAESSNKKAKLTISDEQQGDGDNHIDRLLDEIHIKILSLLPTVDAYRTSFVSKRWRRIWKTIPVIHLAIDFINLVPSPLRSLSCPTSKLRYSVSTLCDSNAIIRGLCINSNCQSLDEIDYWIGVAAERSTQHIRLNIVSDQTLAGYVMYRLPRRFFECKSLCTLHLSGCELNLHGPVDFPSLDMVRLLSVVLGSPVINAVIAGSPMLRDLLLTRCDVRGGLRIEASNSHLSCLTVSPTSRNDEKIVIRAPRLERFTMHLMPSRGVSVIDGLNLRIASLQFEEMWDSVYDLADRHWHSNLVELLSDLSFVGWLHLRGWSLQVFTIWGRENLGPSRAVNWENLILDVFNSQWEIPGIVYLLKTFSPVKNLAINFVRQPYMGIPKPTQIVINTPDFNENDFLRIEELPLASLQHLEVIRLSGLMQLEDIVEEGPDAQAVNSFLERRQHDIMLVKVLLENSPALKQMTSFCRLGNYFGRPELYGELQDAFYQKLQAFARASPTAEVILNYD